MYTLELCPDEISLQILSLLCKQDLQTCRLVSSLMRGKIDRLFNHRWCVILNKKTEKDFVISARTGRRMNQGTAMFPNFRRMKVENVTYFKKNDSGKNHSYPTRNVLLRAEYFESITELEFTEAIRENYFHQIIKLSGYLQILRLSSAVIGGAANLFRSRKTTLSLESAPPALSKIQGVKSISLYGSALLSLFGIGGRKLRRIITGSSSSSCFPNNNNNAWANLAELHIKLDYISPSTPHFSPFLLVQNLRSLRHWAVGNLKAFSVIVDQSKDGEMFYFTIPWLLNLIPVKAFETLSSVAIEVPKCRPEKIRAGGESRRNCDYDQMHLDEFSMNIREGYNHPIPYEARMILRSLKESKRVMLTGFKNSESPLDPDNLEEIF